MEQIDINKKYFSLDKKIKGFYHYTSPEALINIFKNHTLRFTDCMFLNDMEEYNYVVDLLSNLLEDYKSSKEFNFVQSLIGVVIQENIGFNRHNKEEDLYDFRNFKYYVLSGSTNHDSLPLWSYYSKNNNYYGYAIGIEVQKIIEATEKYDGEILFGEVIYDLKRQKEILKATINRITNEYIEEINKIDKSLTLEEQYIEHDRITQNYLGDFYYFIQEVRLFFKNPGFKNEEEYRIVLLANSDTDLGFKKDFVSINGIIKPYIELNFSNVMPSCPIKAIVVSPSINYEVAKNGLKILRNQCIVEREEEIKINHSKLKLRY